MKIRFVICPNIPENIRGKSFQKNCVMKNKGHDWRSIASEEYAFEYIGIKKNTLRRRRFDYKVCLERYKDTRMHSGRPI